MGTKVVESGELEMNTVFRLNGAAATQIIVLPFQLNGTMNDYKFTEFSMTLKFINVMLTLSFAFLDALVKIAATDFTEDPRTKE